MILTKQRSFYELLLSLILALGVAGCGGNDNDAQDEENTSDESPELVWNLISEAFEIVNIETVLTAPDQPVSTYKSGGESEISETEWLNYTPPLPFIKNTTRNLQFNESQFIASPNAPLGTTTFIVTSDGYSWAAMSLAINAVWPYRSTDYSGLSAVNPYFAGNLETTPLPGTVKVTANYKGQNMKFWANADGVPSGTLPLDRYFVRDEWGNEYIMHASSAEGANRVRQAFEAAVLPVGWQKFVRRLAEDLVLHPAEGADGSFHYLVIRDSADNSYHQVSWSSQGSLMAQVPGLVIWGGEGDDTLFGDANGLSDDFIRGAGGNDVIHPGFGNDVVWGDAGHDTVVLPGLRSVYFVVSEDDTSVSLSDGRFVKTLHHVEQLTFNDGSISMASFLRSAGRL